MDTTDCRDWRIELALMGAASLWACVALACADRQEAAQVTNYDATTPKSDTVASLPQGPAAALDVRVTDRRGSPIPSAKLLLSRLEDGEELVTNESGEASFRGLPSQPHALTVTADGYLSAAVGRIDLPVGEISARAVVLDAYGLIQGKVKTADGAPAALASIAILAPEGPRLAAGQADAAGVFGGRPTREGDALVVAELDGAVAYKKLRVVAGKTQAVKLQLGAGLALQGHVESANDTPLSNIAVRILGGATRGKRETLTDAEGRFGFTGLAPSSYELVARRGKGRQATSARSNVAVSEHMGEVTITMPALEGTTIEGRVFADELAISDALVIAYQGRTEIDRCQSGDGGAFRFESLPMGKYRLFVSRGNLRGVLPLHVSEASEPSTIELRAAGTVVTTLQGADGSPVAGARVRLLIGYSEQEVLGSTGENGKATVESLFPGEYRLTIELPKETALKFRPLLFPLGAGEVVHHSPVAIEAR
ncbi:MAG: carboxypeptidase regulatory-like domain-containing protein [Myxococcales bacterium]|nr:carboxypeptidase regulatory-like domain-containing protein [Myxococcales bacterium]